MLSRWADWAGQAPGEVTTSLRLLQLPPLPQLPEPLRGRQLVVINGAVLGDDATAQRRNGATAQRILAPLRELRPELDTFGRAPAASLIRRHMDPEGPTPAASRTAMLGELTDAAIGALLGAAGPGSGTSLLVAAELRQLGGALGRAHPGGGALSMLDGRYVLFALGVAPTPEAHRRSVADATRVVDAMAPYHNGRQYLNFAEDPVDTATAYPASAWQRLRAVRSAVDPHGLFVANHPIPAAS